jgi:hypothetical protein
MSTVTNEVGWDERTGIDEENDPGRFLRNRLN